MIMASEPHHKLSSATAKITVKQEPRELAAIHKPRNQENFPIRNCNRNATIGT